ncbi:MAG: bifunctional phosphopantothenoylcysteine decarboxylase/phosphopantothenate--cysteine ligase CoaBC [Eggerthellaceae bacterium]|nr:bifunctional phosphopantothenoylcysteine decarboxylase/phosphopantothenate--cysteine ligase CoaBC [Eggerthellaceae bacterium]
MQKTVVLGVTGCVAIYKACEVLRGLQKAGVRVKVVMTKNATEFIQPAMFRALMREPVAVGLFDDAPGDPIHHISLAKEADLFLVAPCTANVMAKLAHGIADDLLTTTALATTAPIAIAPAMNVNMYDHVATQENMQTLKARGVRFIDAGEGYLACGDVGRGRLAEPDDIVAAAIEMLEVTHDLAGKHVLVTAGPTVEPIDPARYISNRSSGKTGFAIARAALNRGAKVTLVTGPVALGDVEGADMARVTTALQMRDAVDAAFDDADIAVFSAAVCDARPSNPSKRKLKKGADDEALMHIELTENPDILATMAGRKRPEQVVVGFAAETENVVANARAKLERKHADMIVGNLVGEGRGFATDENEVVFVYADRERRLPLMNKDDLAHAILDEALEKLE